MPRLPRPGLEDVEIGDLFVIKLTDEDIKKGVRGDFWNDPISIAVKREFGEQWAMIGWGYSRTGTGSLQHDWDIKEGEQIRHWYHQWENNKMVPKISLTFILREEIDKTPKPKTRRIARHKNFSDLQERLDLQ